MTTKTRTTTGWVLAILLAALFLFSAYAKFTLSGNMLKQAATMGFSGSRIKLLAVLELLCIILFIIPRTGVLGSLLLMAYSGGIIATHIEHNLPVMIPILVTCVVFITAVIRFPELTHRIPARVQQPQNSNTSALV